MEPDVTEVNSVFWKSMPNIEVNDPAKSATIEYIDSYGSIIRRETFTGDKPSWAIHDEAGQWNQADWSKAMPKQNHLNQGLFEQIRNNNTHHYKGFEKNDLDELLKKFGDVGRVGVDPFNWNPEPVKKVKPIPLWIQKRQK